MKIQTPENVDIFIDQVGIYETAISGIVLENPEYILDQKFRNSLVKGIEDIKNVIGRRMSVFEALLKDVKELNTSSEMVALHKKLEEGLADSRRGMESRELAVNFLSGMMAALRGAKSLEEFKFVYIKLLKKGNQSDKEAATYYLKYANDWLFETIDYPTAIQIRAELIKQLIETEDKEAAMFAEGYAAKSKVIDKFVLTASKDPDNIGPLELMVLLKEVMEMTNDNH